LRSTFKKYKSKSRNSSRLYNECSRRR